MTREEIIRLAQEAGLSWDDKYHWYVGSEALERFANLVAAAERDRCCQIIFRTAGSVNAAQATVDLIRGKE